MYRITVQPCESWLTGTTKISITLSLAEISPMSIHRRLIPPIDRPSGLRRNRCRRRILWPPEISSEPIGSNRSSADGSWFFFSTSAPVGFIRFPNQRWIVPPIRFRHPSSRMVSVTLSLSGILGGNVISRPISTNPDEWPVHWKIRDLSTFARSARVGNRGRVFFADLFALIRSGGIFGFAGCRFTGNFQ
jgi:hypothetical protein